MYPIETIELTKIYRKTSQGIEGIEKISLKLSEGQILSLLGPNGAGKTTFIKIISSQILPDSGEVFIYGNPLCKIIKESQILIRQQIGYLPETPFFYAKLTGWEFARFMESIYNCPLEEGGSLSFHSIADAFNLTSHLNKLIASYSQGMLRKLVLCFAITFGKKIIILDEPSNGLDPDSYLTLKDILRECRAQKRAILLSTHHLSLAQEIADEIAIFHQGHIKCKVKNDGSVEVLYKKIIHEVKNIE